MINKIIKAIAVLLSIAQVGFMAYFLIVYTTDNLPLFIFLIIVPLVNIFTIISAKTYDKNN